MIFGLIKTLVMDLLTLAVVALLMLLAVAKFTQSAIDDSDLDADHRSGLRVYTDYKTGIQYLGQITGGLVPRLNADGSVMRVEVPK
jgi:hypothetical protein